MFWWITLLFLWSNECCQFDLWFLCLFFFSFAFSTPISFCRDLLNPGTEPVFPVSLALQGDSLLLEPLGKLCTHGPLPFLNPAWISLSSQFTYSVQSLAWRILSLTLWACEISTIVQKFEHSLALPFFGIGMKTDLFQSCGHCWVFQICLHIECSTLTASSFRIWNSSAGIPSPPLALFVVMLPKAHLTSCSRISGSRWMTTSWWLSRSLRAFLYSSVYSWHLFLASLLLLGPYFFCLLSCQSLHEMSPGISNFLEEICSLSHSTVFLYFFALFIEDLFISPILWNSAFSWIYLSLSSLPFTSLLCLAICKTSSDNHFAFLHFSLGWILCSPLLQCYKPSSIVLIPWILFVTSTVWS